MALRLSTESGVSTIIQINAIRVSIASSFLSNVKVSKCKKLPVPKKAQGAIITK